MKQLIAPIAIIVALIAFFVIIDRKNFYSSGDVAVQKEDVRRKPTSVTTLKPVAGQATEPVKSIEDVVEMKPTEGKSAKTKPVAETNPVEAKPAMETKTVETKPATVKPVEMKPVTDTKPIETKPVAEKQSVPFVLP